MNVINEFKGLLLQGHLMLGGITKLTLLQFEFGEREKKKLHFSLSENWSLVKTQTSIFPYPAKKNVTF